MTLVYPGSVKTTASPVSPTARPSGKRELPGGVTSHYVLVGVAPPAGDAGKCTGLFKNVYQGFLSIQLHNI